MVTADQTGYRRLLVSFLLAVCLVWSFWPTLLELARRWSYDPQYSHGYFVPLFSLYLLWQHRHHFAGAPSPSWWGVLLVLAGVTLRLAGGFFFFPWLDAAALLPTLAGLCLLAGGWPALRQCWLAVGFLAFMLPLPYGLQTALAQPLQRIATLASVYLLETFGLPAVARGNIILIGETRIGVVEACNGLSMLVTFFALSTAVAILTRRGTIERVVVLVSAIPIALVANILRITITAVLHETVGGPAADMFFHDLAGWLMMPLGLALLGLELLVLRCLLVEDKQRDSTPVPATAGLLPSGRPMRREKTAAPRA